MKFWIPKRSIQPAASHNPSAPVIVARGKRIEVRAPALFHAAAGEDCVRFLAGVFRVEEVAAVELDFSRGAATIDGQGQFDPAAMLEKMAEALEWPAAAISAESLRSRLRQRLGPRLKIRRHEVVRLLAVVAAEDETTIESEGLVVGFRRTLYLSLASTSFSLAVVGVAVPGVPTVPFLLATSYFLVRSSPAMNERLLQSRTFGPLLRDWHERRGIRARVKAWALAVMAIMVTITVFTAGLSIVLLILVLVMVALGMLMLLRIPTLSDRAEQGEFTTDDPFARFRQLQIGMA